MSDILCQEPISTGITNGKETYEPCGRPVKKGFKICKGHFRSASYTYKTDNEETKKKRKLAASGPTL